MTQPIHLLACVHGMWGDPIHLGAISRKIQETFPHDSTKPGQPQLEVLVATANKGNHTYDGIDWGAERVATELYEFIAKLEEGGDRKVTRFSLLGYSLGGLISRYLIGILVTRGFFKDVEAYNFYTFATPHIGLPRYPSFISSVMTTFGPKLLSRTGEQFYGVDKWGTTGKPILEVMADHSAVFYKGLARFQRVNIYANTISDITVPYCTAAIETYDPFFGHERNGVKIEFNDKYPHLIEKWTLPDPSTLAAPPAILSAAYLRSLIPSKPFLPPPLQFRYPYNIVFLVASPVLVPILLPVLVIRLITIFSRASAESRTRIKLLESEELAHTRLVNVLSRPQTPTPEDAEADGSSTPSANGNIEETLFPTSAVPSSAPTDVPLDSVDNIDGPVPEANTLAGAAGEQPLLTETQVRIAGWLNKLPQLRKHLVYIGGVRNAHAPIVCRSEAQNQGADVVQHWADHFVL